MAASMTRTSDYGGHGQDRKAATARKIKDKNHRSYFCLDCGKRRLVHPKELGRRAMPRCTSCGGTLEETETSVKRRLGVTKKQLAKELNDGLGVYEIKQYECPHCHERFRSQGGLAVHVNERHADFDVEG